MSEEINIYCDESCHLEHDNCPSMILGAIICPKMYVKDFADQIKKLKRENKLSSKAEIKWTKAAKSKEKFFIELVELFAKTPYVKFRAVKAINKDKLRHKEFNDTHDDWYYKMYYYLLIHIIKYKDSDYNVYIDIKDTKSSQKRVQLRNCIASTYVNSGEWFEGKVADRIKNIQAIRSEESQLLQLADVLIGAVGYEERVSKIKTEKPSFAPSDTKLNICKHIKKVFKLKSFEERNTPSKFNLFIWAPDYKRNANA